MMFLNQWKLLFYKFQTEEKEIKSNIIDTCQYNLNLSFVSIFQSNWLISLLNHLLLIIVFRTIYKFYNYISMEEIYEI
jgi:hypothetical protein